MSLNAPLTFGGNPPTIGIGSSIPSGNMLDGDFPPLSGNLFGNYSTYIPNLNWGPFAAGAGVSSTNPPNSGPNFWNVGGSGGGSYSGNPANTGFHHGSNLNLGSFSQTKLLFLATLNLLDLSKLTNDHVQHLPG